VLADFFNWFADSITSDAIFENLKRKFDKLFPGERRKSDAFLALTVYWGKNSKTKFGNIGEDWMLLPNVKVVLYH